ncbi:hypothetical protein S40293_04326 [Stachybotrys chartarum IBT 40293]|nr:hypothetical protein S40293_04326 [Stachybotrys chartarum IBT 40293]
MSFDREPYDDSAASYPICTACTTQFPPSPSRSTCFVCDDPRQFVPPSGQSFTTLAALRSSHRNEFTTYAADPRLTFIETTPKLGIGQRAVLVRTPAGNVLWDCVALLDDETVRRVREMGGLRALVISHPHYYSTHVLWARAFGCPVYLAAEDREWLAASSSHQTFLTETATPILDTGFTAIKLGGHFPGSLVGLFSSRLFIADTLVTTPAGRGDWSRDAAGQLRAGRPPGMNTFAFLWSIPNMIPLAADEVARMWSVLRGFEFAATHGAFAGMDIEDEGIKGRVLESMKIQVRYMGYGEHALLQEEC